MKEVAHGREEEGDQQGQEEGPGEEEGRQEEEVSRTGSKFTLGT